MAKVMTRGFKQRVIDCYDGKAKAQYSELSAGLTDDQFLVKRRVKMKDDRNRADKVLEGFIRENLAYFMMNRDQLTEGQIQAIDRFLERESRG